MNWLELVKGDLICKTSFVNPFVAPEGAAESLINCLESVADNLLFQLTWRILCSPHVLSAGSES